LTPVSSYRALGRWLGPFFARRFPRRFGLFELLGLGSIEASRRHLAIVNELENLRRKAGLPVLDILDFGGAEGSLGRTLRMYGLESHYRVTLADIDEAALKVAAAVANARVVTLEPEGTLPFADASFDVAVSSDVFEHIPKSARQGRADELRRVSRLGQVHSVPADDGGHHWNSVQVDEDFAAWQRESFGAPDRWTGEHLEKGVPSLDDLRELFPQGRISGIVSGRVWAATMRAKYGPATPWHRVRFALTYARQLRKLERKAPFKTALIVAMVSLHVDAPLIDQDEV